MTELILNLFRDTLLITGSVMILIGALGVIRLPDFFTRIHATGITDTAGVGLITIALLIESEFGPVPLKLLFIGLFILITSPTSSHALAKAALHGNLKPFAARDAE